MASPTVHCRVTNASCLNRMMRRTQLCPRMHCQNMPSASGTDRLCATVIITMVTLSKVAWQQHKSLQELLHCFVFHISEV